MNATINEIEERLRRMETKMIRGFEELGIDTDVDPNWLTVDDPARVIYIGTLGRSLQVIKKQAIKRGAAQKGRSYDLIHKGDCVGTLYL